ncbi:Ras GTPase activating protein ira2 [Lecanicillium sp. MT-2017a]|nr:Ras GTPase activating protein ira2 [Lecanicillium sp. MT-2017a]
MDSKTLHEWRNLAGLLAATSGICTADQAIILEEPSLSGLRWIDRNSSNGAEETHLTRYLRSGVKLLACKNVKVRESMREILTHDVPSTIYQPLFKALESEVEELLSGAWTANAPSAQDNGFVFAEQAVLLLKDMVGKLGGPYDLASSSVHLGAITLSFAKFIGGRADNASSIRVKIRVCQLCEAVTSRKEHLNVRDDVVIRNQLLDNIFGWINRSGYHTEMGRGNTRIEETERLQRDLDTACLKALADLTFRLPLQPPDIQYDTGTSAKKSELFQNYFNRFLDLLNHEASSIGQSSAETSIAPNGFELQPNSELAIAILSNLLSANIDVGLKHSLNLGYHENVEIRTAFIKVLYNILTQGTEFSNLTDSAISEKYEELLDLLTEDLSLAVSMSAICPGSEIDELTVCLLIVFEQRGRTFDLLDALIKEEMEQTENATEILRRTCVATKMLSLYAKWKGFAYLRSTLHSILDRLVLTSQELDLELDPARVSTAEELEKNAVQLQIVAKVFMDDICASAPNIPSSFRKICNIQLLLLKLKASLTRRHRKK